MESQDTKCQLLAILDRVNASVNIVEMVIKETGGSNVILINELLKIKKEIDKILILNGIDV